MWKNKRSEWRLNGYWIIGIEWHTLMSFKVYTVDQWGLYCKINEGRESELGKTLKNKCNI